ncbi:MAG: 50S ribosomal protein L10 [Gemmatimonadota bacterium]|nr:MAG: 50S ribosomal protein L10 [Gemmatimonadota bacterium]
MAQRSRNQKIEVTAELVNRLGDARVLYLADFTGLNVKDMTELRRRFREAGTRFIVVKNRLALRALEQLDLPDISEHLRGPTGFVIGGDDPIIPAKTLREFAKEYEDRPAVKVGVVDNRIVSAEEIRQLADLPPREELLANIMSSLTAPVAGIAGVLNGLLRNLAYMIEEVARQRGAGGE